MINTAPDAPFGGFPDIPADPATTGQVMQFVSTRLLAGILIRLATRPLPLRTWCSACRILAIPPMALLARSARPGTARRRVAVGLRRLDPNGVRELRQECHA